MPFVERTAVVKRLQIEAFNSSHFLWAFADLEFFESHNGWLFAFKRVGRVTLFALEPIPPASVESDSFEEAWKELFKTQSIKIAAFVGVGPSFVDILAQANFRICQVGREPWVSLDDFLPRGNDGKGIRSARNKALRLGVQVEEWTGSEIEQDSSKKKALLRLHNEWRHSSLFHMNGFLLVCDAFQLPEHRRYFVARTPEGEVGYLIASSICSQTSSLFEDLILSPSAPSGTGELLTLHALSALQTRGVKEVSLGAVSMGEMKAVQGLPDRLVQRTRILMRLFYNAAGIDLFRRRFKVREWRPIFLAFQEGANVRAPIAWLWMEVIAALVWAFKPRFEPSLFYFKSEAQDYLVKYPVTILWCALSLFLYACQTSSSFLHGWLLKNFGFSLHAPYSEWLYRSFLSDFLFDSPGAFWILLVVALVLLPRMERRWRSRWVAPTLLAIILLDDPLNYLLVIRPLHFLHHPILKDVIGNSRVGSSLVLATVAGVLVSAYREPLFVAVTLLVLFIFPYFSSEPHFLASKMNYFIFVALGYLIGKVQLSLSRQQSRRAARGKKVVAGGS